MLDAPAQSRERGEGYERCLCVSRAHRLLVEGLDGALQKCERGDCDAQGEEEPTQVLALREVLLQVLRNNHMRVKGAKIGEFQCKGGARWVPADNHKQHLAVALVLDVQLGEHKLVLCDKESLFASALQIGQLHSEKIELADRGPLAVELRHTAAVVREQE